MPGMLEDIIEHTKEAAGRYLSQPHTRVSGVQVGQRGGDFLDFHIATKKLGQTLCRFDAADCARCPLRTDCRARGN